MTPSNPDETAAKTSEVTGTNNPATNATKGQLDRKDPEYWANVANGQTDDDLKKTIYHSPNTEAKEQAMHELQARALNAAMESGNEAKYQRLRDLIAMSNNERISPADRKELNLILGLPENHDPDMTANDPE